MVDGQLVSVLKAVRIQLRQWKYSIRHSKSAEALGTIYKQRNNKAG
jgi:hypothetical protein